MEKNKDLQIEDESNKNRLIVVSDLFIDIYKNFNVVDQIDKIKELSQKEIYLLLLLCLDKFSDKDPVAVFNFKPFKEECKEIFNIQDDKESSNQILIDLVEESGDKYIETDFICSKTGDKMPDPLTREEVRDAKINLINDEE